MVKVEKQAADYSDGTGRITVGAWNLFHLSALLHHSAMAHMHIDSPREEKLFLGCAVQGECGELGNVIKKIARDGPSQKLLEEAAMEVADVYLYLDHICKLLGIEATDAMVKKTDLLLNVRQPEWARQAIEAVGGTYVRIGNEENARPN
jgi:hypothetical protein